MSHRAFAIAAHPDAIEVGMAGTMILLKKAGWETHYMNVANGSCGTAEHDAETIVKIRRQEAQNAAERPQGQTRGRQDRQGQGTAQGGMLGRAVSLRG